MGHQPFGLVPSPRFDLPPEPRTLLSLAVVSVFLSASTQSSDARCAAAGRPEGKGEGITLRTCPEDLISEDKTEGEQP